MAAMNELKAVHMPSESHREFRSLVKYRKTLDSRINKMKCKIRAWFVNHGISIDTGEKAWNTGRERINSFSKPLADCQPNEFWKGELDLELMQLDSLTTILMEWSRSWRLSVRPIHALPACKPFQRRATNSRDPRRLHRRCETF